MKEFLWTKGIWQKGQCEQKAGGLNRHGSRAELAWAQGAGGKMAEDPPGGEGSTAPFEFCPRDLW